MKGQGQTPCQRHSAANVPLVTPCHTGSGHCCSPEHQGSGSPPVAVIPWIIMDPTSWQGGHRYCGVPPWVTAAACRQGPDEEQPRLSEVPGKPQLLMGKLAPVQPFPREAPEKMFSNGLGLCGGSSGRHWEASNSPVPPGPQAWH